MEVAQRLHLRAGVHRLRPGRHRWDPLDARGRYEVAAGRFGVGDPKAILAVQTIRGAEPTGEAESHGGQGGRQRPAEGGSRS